MHELIQRLLVQAHAAWRWRWLGLAVAWVVSCISWIGIEFIPEYYNSEARVEIDTESMLGSLMRGMAAEVETADYLRTDLIRRSMLSRSNLEKVMRMTDLDIMATSVVETEEILGSLRSRLTIIQGGRDRSIFAISFYDRDPSLAQRVVEALLTLFVETNLGESREDIARTQRFLRLEVGEIEKEIDAAETYLAEFRILNQELLPGPGSVQEQLREGLAELQGLKERRVEELRVRDQLKLELARFSEDTSYNPSLSPQAARVAELEKELQLLLVKFKESYPEVAALRRLLEAERAALEASEAAGAGGTYPSIVANPNSRTELVRIQISEINTRIGELDRRIGSLEKKIEDLRVSTKSVPAIRAQYAQLEREYEVLRQNHVALLERREKAQYAEAIDAKSESVQFRVIEPANFPTLSRGPDRKLLRAGSLAGGVGGGIALAFMLAIAFPTFGTTQELQSFCRRPVIGKISLSSGPLERWRRRTGSTVFAVSSIGLLALGGLVATGLPGRIVYFLKDYLPAASMWPRSLIERVFSWIV
jgi:polysaccharide chain length determinant protein (PEP-CTERM system associated)